MPNAPSIAFRPVTFREYESLEGRSSPNVYEDLHGTTSGEREIYITTAIAEGDSGSGN
ncbi:hypothetical protein KP79_PYT02768 [Mizuhopecten yessoensis]|uniref:Uncharacterized protein n=1 Tax=Mizuhopecten yessoensis TaxID=6573 RepID=A0A210PK20_MIZYE|nr:hypothetical protein KP79_PYT02768 [Mizuhopecten yessoensis]